MADTIQTDYDALDEVQQRFSSVFVVIEDRERLLREITQTVSERGWEGRGSEAFFSEMDGEILPAISDLTEALQAANQALEQIAQKFRQAEEETRSVFEALSR